MVRLLGSSLTIAHMDETEAFARFDGDPHRRVVLTCEHASPALPDPWAWHADDQWLAETHWASDLGAAAFARRLARRLVVPAVLSRFSRLLVDPNRPLDSDTLFRREADGRAVRLNQSIDAGERQRRLDCFYHPYHRAVSAMVEQSTAEIVFGIHSFTDEYEGRARTLEVGVLYDRDEALALRLVEHLRNAGFVTAPNEPYSGRNGLAYSPVLHAAEFGRRALEIEVRQDLVVDDTFASRLIDALGSFLE